MPAVISDINIGYVLTRESKYNVNDNTILFQIYPQSKQIGFSVQFSSVQLLNRVQLFATP